MVEDGAAVHDKIRLVALILLHYRRSGAYPRLCDTWELIQLSLILRIDQAFGVWAKVSANKRGLAYAT
jgi:hypothetical protein